MEDQRYFKRVPIKLINIHIKYTKYNNKKINNYTKTI